MIAYLGGFGSPGPGTTRGDLVAVGTTGALLAGLASVATTPLFGALRQTGLVGRVRGRGGLRPALGGAVVVDDRHGKPAWIVVAMVGGLAFGANGMSGAQCAHFAELFGDRPVHRNQGRDLTGLDDAVG